MPDVQSVAGTTAAANADYFYCHFIEREEVFGAPEIALVKDVYLWLVSRLSIFIPMLQHALLAESHFEIFWRYMLKEPFNFQTFCTTLT